MVDDKYYTPDITDLRIGYIGEYSPMEGVWKKYLIRPNTNIRFLTGKCLRTRYLTLKQIEREGFKLSYPCEDGSLVFTGPYDCMIVYNEQTKRLQMYGHRSWHSHVLCICDAICMSINEFRMLVRLVNFEDNKHHWSFPDPLKKQPSLLRKLYNVIIYGRSHYGWD